MEDRGLTASTIDRLLSTACGLYRFAHIDGRITSNPAQYVRRPTVHPSERRGLDRSDLGRCPILVRRDGQRLDRRTAHRWVRSIGKRAGIGLMNPHMLRAAFILAALDAGVPLREVRVAARHADPRTTTVYDRRRQEFDKHAAYVVVAFVAGG
jgi:site-specific recombinase XerD